MEIESFRSTIPDSFFDPLSGKIMMDPVCLLASGITYERSEIIRYMETQRANIGMVDPLTKTFIPSFFIHFTEDNKLRDAIASHMMECGNKVFLSQRGEVSPNIKTLYIKTMTGKTIVLEHDLQSTVFTLKQAIEDMESIPADQMRLVYKGKQLEDGSLLSFCGIEDKSDIFLILRLRGGMFHESSGRQGFSTIETLKAVPIPWKYPEYLTSIMDSMLGTFKGPSLEQRHCTWRSTDSRL